MYKLIVELINFLINDQHKKTTRKNNKKKIIVAGDKNYYYANVWLSLWSVLFDLNLH
jgi:hypothetical protein